MTKKGDKIGRCKIKSITPISADKIDSIIIVDRHGERLRQGEKAVALCRRAWRVVHRLYPAEFDRDVPNLWDDVTRKRRKKDQGCRDMEQVYQFAWGATELGSPEAAAAAVICFEWLQRPENVLAGYLRWSDYRSAEWPNAIKIERHKTGAVVWQPLEETTEAGTVKFYVEAEQILVCLPRLGLPIMGHHGHLIQPAKKLSSFWLRSEEASTPPE